MADTVDSPLDYLELQGSTKLNFRSQFWACSIVQNSWFVVSHLSIDDRVSDHTWERIIIYTVVLFFISLAPAFLTFVGSFTDL